MRLNELKPGRGARKPAKRLGRGAGSGSGKTASRGHKGQHSRSGSGILAGFEGGQMPLQRRLPKFGFASRKQRFVGELRLDALESIDEEVVDLGTLKDVGLVPQYLKRVKVILAGTLGRAVNLRGIQVTKGARAAIEAAGGTIADE